MKSLLTALLYRYADPMPIKPRDAIAEHGYREGMAEAARHITGAYTGFAIYIAVMDTLDEVPKPEPRRTDSTYPAEREAWEARAVARLAQKLGVDLEVEA